jgi:integrase
MELQMRNWKKMADKPMTAVRETEIADHVAVIRKTIDHNMVVQVRYWNAMQNSCIERRLTSGPKVKPLVPEATKLRFLSEAEENRLYAALAVPDQYSGKNPMNDRFKQDNQDLMVCLLHLGARISEAEKLRWADVDFEQNTVYVRRLKRGKFEDLWIKS